MAYINEVVLVEILESVRSLSYDAASEALKLLEKCGITADASLPYSRVAYEYAGKELCRKLEGLGFSGRLDFIGKYIAGEGNCYAVYDSEIYSHRYALEWLENFYQSASQD